MKFQIQKDSDFSYMETLPENKEYPLLLLHGLMGALSNFETIVDSFSKKMNVVVPMLPIFEMPLKSLSVDGLVDYVYKFIKFKKYEKVHVLGNSLGGHICQLLALQHPEVVHSIILTGSSGLFESAMGNTFPKRGSYEYIRQKTEMVFYNPENASQELIDEVYDIVNDLGKCIRIVKTAKSAVRHNLENRLVEIKQPVLLIWGEDDEVTPAWVGKKFHDLLPNSELHIFEKCGHVAMMEHPKEFNEILESFLNRVSNSVAIV